MASNKALQQSGLVVKQLQDKKKHKSTPLWWLCWFNYFWEGTRGGGFQQAFLSPGHKRALKGHGQPLAEVAQSDSLVLLFFTTSSVQACLAEDSTPQKSPDFLIEE